MTVFDKLEAAARRDYSDDYDVREPTQRSGSDYTIRSGDVVFTMRHENYRCHAFDAYVDGVRVLRYSFAQATHARFNDEPAKATWLFDSIKLQSHVERAAQQIVSRHWRAEMDRIAAERKKQELKDEKMDAFKERFGIT